MNYAKETGCTEGAKHFLNFVYKKNSGPHEKQKPPLPSVKNDSSLVNLTLMLYNVVLIA